jgi:hypothetical protein
LHIAYTISRDDGNSNVELDKEIMELLLKLLFLKPPFLLLY